MNRVLIAAIFCAVALACSKEKAPDVLNQGSEPQATARTLQCTVPNSDGVRCDVKTCKADAASDCAQFKDGCVNNNHTYTGDDQGGTCKRGPLIGRAREHRPTRVYASTNTPANAITTGSA